ncbi:MAG: hypothetical protein IKA17_02875 [Clostridia bacterium]|nr:hypothetical protein [Clostridia bacterium]
MNFKNKRYITKGVSEKVSLLLQLFMWECIDNLTVPKDYLQVFKLSAENIKQKIEHIQDEPDYIEYQKRRNKCKKRIYYKEDIGVVEDSYYFDIR